MTNHFFPFPQAMAAQRCGRQQGAMVLTVAVSLLFLLGFMGLSLDFARLFVIRAELQNALDSCALAAASELDKSPTALARARAAGVQAGNLQGVNFQSQRWADQGQLTAQTLSFSDINNNATSLSGQAVYARCAHRHAAKGAWLLPALDAFAGTARLASVHQVAAYAVATRASAQSSCPVPLALRPKDKGQAPGYGFAKGDWVSLPAKSGLPAAGLLGWANLDGSSSSAQTVRQFKGFCGTQIGDALGKPGVEAGLADVWNLRFGILKNKDELSTSEPPDVTGYAYTATNWKAQRNAYAGPAPKGNDDDDDDGSSKTAQNYQTKASQYASCGNTSSKLSDCEKITGLNMKGGFKSLAAPGLDPDDEGHYRYGAKNRRIVTVPVVNSASQVIDFACMLLLEPLSIPVVGVRLEFLGNAGAADSPCTTAGVPGGQGGPLVPTLVR